MNDIIKNNNIKGPINLLFVRSQNNNKKNNSKYNMSGIMPKINVQTEDSSRPTVKLKNPVSVNGIDLIKDDSSDNESVESGSTIEPSVPHRKKSPKKEKKSSIMPSKSKTHFDAEQYQQFLNNSKTKTPKEIEDSASESGSDAASESGSDGSGYSDYSDYSNASGSEASEKGKKKQVVRTKSKKFY